MDGFTIAFYLTISVVALLSIFFSSWIVYKCRRINYGYAGLDLGNAEILRHYVYRLAIFDVLFSLHYFKILFTFLGDDSIFESGAGKSFCIVLAIYTEFCLIATITWYFFISVLLVYTFKVGREPEMSRKMLNAQRSAVMVIGLIFVVIPAFIEGGFVNAYGPQRIVHVDVVTCDLEGRGEIPHDIYVAMLVTFSLISLFVVMYLSRNAWLAARTNRRTFVIFMWKRVSFTTAFVVTYMWRPLIKFTGMTDNSVLWFIANVYIASSGVCYYLMWFLQIHHHDKMVKTLSLQRKKTTSQFIFHNMKRGPHSRQSSRTSLASIDSMNDVGIDFYALQSETGSIPDFSAGTSGLVPYSFGNINHSIQTVHEEVDMQSSPGPAPSSFSSSAGVVIFNRISVRRDEECDNGGALMEDYSYSGNQSIRPLLANSYQDSSYPCSARPSFGKVDSLLLAESYSTIDTILNTTLPD